MNRRTSYITDKVLYSYLLASILASVVGTIDGIADSVIVSRSVSPDALSIVSLVVPVSSVLGIFLGLMNSGVTYLASRAVGRNDRKNVKELFTLLFIYTAVVTVAGTALILPFTDNIAEFISKDSRLLPMLKSYMKVELFSVCLRYLSMILIVFVRICGRPDLVPRRIIAETVCNILLDLLFCAVLDFGVAGASIATGISIILSSAVFIPYLRSDNCLIGFTDIRDCGLALFCKSLKAGIPILLSSILYPIVSFLINKLILNKIGADGIYQYCLFGQAFSLCTLVLAGCIQAITCLGGMMIGEEDYQGVRMLFGKTVKIILAVVSAVTVLFFVFPKAIAGLYGASAENIAAIDSTFRYVALAFIPSCISSLLFATYYITGHHKICSFLTIFKELLPLALFLLISSLWPGWIWFTIPTYSIISLIITIGVSLLASRNEVFVSRLTLIPAISDNPQICFSVPYSEIGLLEVNPKLQKFIKICEYDKSTQIRVALEEVMYSRLENNTARLKGDVFDVRIIDRPDGITLTVKDYGPEWNPFFSYNVDQIDNLSQENLRVAVLGRMCDKISHRYMNGVNSTDIYISRGLREEVFGKPKM